MAESKSAALPLGYAQSRRETIPATPNAADRCGRTIATRARRTKGPIGPAGRRPIGAPPYYICASVGPIHAQWKTAKKHAQAEPSSASGAKLMAYRAPVEDMCFTLKHGAGLRQSARRGLYEDLSDDLLEAVLGEAGRLAAEVIGAARYRRRPVGTPFRDGAVTARPGWKEAYGLGGGGWNGLASPAEWGGQGCRGRSMPCASKCGIRPPWRSDRSRADHGGGRFARWRTGRRVQKDAICQR